MEERVLDLRNRLAGELRDNILDFWIRYTQDLENGGFYGYVSVDRTVDRRHERSAVLNARILWTFSAASAALDDPRHLETARRAYDYLLEHFVDRDYGGVFWMVDFKGNPVNTKKQVYAAAFAIYALSEYYMAAGEKASLEAAQALFASLEEHSRDRVNGGYLEALSRDWSPLADVSLSKKDLNVAKSMNTHLHVLEAYTNLLRAKRNDSVAESLRNLLTVVMDKIIDSDTASFQLFFDADWTRRSNTVSFGHDIEGSWLLFEAAKVLGDPAMLARASELSIRMARRVLEKGVDNELGGVFNEAGNDKIIDDNKDWWPQAEAVVGFFSAYEMTGDPRFLAASLDTWGFIDRFLIDKKNGEWFVGVDRGGHKILGQEKVSPWKCPYHNGRMCIEMLNRINRGLDDA